MNELMALLYFLLPQLFGSPRDYEELKLHLARAQKRRVPLPSAHDQRHDDTRVWGSSSRNGGGRLTWLMRLVLATSQV